MLTPDERFALEMARLYRRKGFNPIPSAMEGKKKPLYPFAEEYGWDRKFPDEWFDEDNWRTTNIQVQTGRPWRLLVIDLDGSEARYIWGQWGRTPRTWTTHRESGDSWHLWFRLPPNYPDRLPAKFLWKGEDKHQGIERLCDCSLIVAPPSFHVVHRESRYRFLDENHSPRRLPLPADCPRWVLDRQPIGQLRRDGEYTPPRPKLLPRSSNPEAFMSRDEVLSRIHDKIGVARDWGLQFTGRVSPGGWAECHAIGRPDQKPSAAMNIHSGVYTDRGTHETIPFFDAIAAARGLSSWKEAKDELAARFR